MVNSQNPKRAVEILIVEDNPGDVKLTSLALGMLKHSHQLSHVQHSREALDFLNKRGNHSEAKRPDIVFLDWNLPPVDGGDVLREIRQSPDLKDIPVLVLTTSGSDDTKNEVYKAGADFFINKPMNLEDFSSALKYVLEVFLNKKVQSE